MINKISLDDFKVIIKGLKAAFPRDKFIDNDYTLNLWYTALQDIDYPTLNRAATSYVMSKKFPPTIADIRQLAFDLTAPPDDLPGEEWARLMRAMGYAGSPEAADYWNALPEATKTIVGGFSEFVQWANTPTVDLMSVQRPMFIKRFEEHMRVQRARGSTPAVLTPPVKQLTQQTVARLEEKTSHKSGGGVEAPSDMMARLRERLK